MKANLYSHEGKKLKQVDIPAFFESPVRLDLIQKVTEALKRKQPYAPNVLAGNNYSASGKLKHHRHVWKSQYGRGMSRVPRKQMSRSGTQFSWVAATVPNTRGGRRAHPPKAESMVNYVKINKKEMRLAEISALSATASEKWLTKKYSSLSGEKIKELPFIVDKFPDKSKDLMKGMKEMLGEKLFSVAVQKKEIRSGRGKHRGRKHKNNAGLLVVVGNGEKLRTSAFDVRGAKDISVTDLAKGGPGRLTLYTEKAVQELEAKFSGKKKAPEEKIEKKKVESKPKKSTKTKENKK